MESGIASNLISAYVTSFIISIFFVLTYSEGIYYSLFFAAYFFVFSFVSIVAVPITLLVEKLVKGMERAVIQLSIRFVSGFLMCGSASLIMALIGFNVTGKLFFYGVTSYFLYFLMNILIGLLENKVKVIRSEG